MLLGPLCHVPSPMSHLALDLRSSFRTVSPTCIYPDLGPRAEVRSDARTCLGPDRGSITSSRVTSDTHISIFAFRARYTFDRVRATILASRTQIKNTERPAGVGRFFCFFLRTQINQRSRSNLRTRSARAQQLAPMHTQPSHVRRHAASRTYFASLPCQCSLSPSSPYLHLSERKERDASLLRILEHHLLSTRAAPPPFRQVPCSWRT